MPMASAREALRENLQWRVPLMINPFSNPTKSARPYGGLALDVNLVDGATWRRLPASSHQQFVADQADVGDAQTLGVGQHRGHVLVLGQPVRANVELGLQILLRGLYEA